MSIMPSSPAKILNSIHQEGSSSAASSQEPSVDSFIIEMERYNAKGVFDKGNVDYLKRKIEKLFSSEEQNKIQFLGEIVYAFVNSHPYRDKNKRTAAWVVKNYSKSDKSVEYFLPLVCAVSVEDTENLSGQINGKIRFILGENTPIIDEINESISFLQNIKGGDNLFVELYNNFISEGESNSLNQYLLNQYLELNTFLFKLNQVTNKVLLLIQDDMRLNFEIRNAGHFEALVKKLFTPESIYSDEIESTSFDDEGDDDDFKLFDSDEELSEPDEEPSYSDELKAKFKDYIGELLLSMKVVHGDMTAASKMLFFSDFSVTARDVFNPYSPCF